MICFATVDTKDVVFVLAVDGSVYTPFSLDAYNDTKSFNPSSFFVLCVVR